MDENKALENKSQIELESAPIGKLMVKYSLPCVVSLVVSALYNIVDQLFIANASYLGSYGNAANTTVFPLVIICLAIAGMFGDGTNAYFTFCTGAGRTKEGKNTVGTAVTTIIILGVLFMAGYLIFSNQLLGLFGANVNAETFSNAKEYLFWIAFGLPFYMLGQTLSPIICGDGSPRYAMVTMLIGCGINIVMDPILIYVTHWGMKGAAIATIAGQIVVCILNVSYLSRMKTVKLSKESFKIRISCLKQIIPLGMTSFFAQLSIVLSMAAVNNVLKIYGAQDPIFSQEAYSQIPLAVVGLVFKFFQIIVSVAIGITAGCVPIIGYNRGAGRSDRLMSLLKKILKVEIIVGVIAFIIFEGFARPITYLFGAANESIYYQDFAITCIRLFLCMVILSCVNKGMMIFLQGMGKAVQSTSISVLREIVGGVLLPIILPAIFGFDGILFFMPCAEILTFILAVIFTTKLWKELKGSVNEDQAATGVAVNSGTSGIYDDINAAPALYSKSENEDDKTLKPLTDMVITIGRSYGSGGRTVGKILADKLNIPYYDASLLEKAAKKSGMDQKFLESVDEKPIDISALYQYSGLIRTDYESIQGMANQAQREIIESVANEGPCVIVGRRADQILSERDNIFSVFVAASKESRTARVSKRDHLNELNSLKKIEKVDKERASYYNQYADKLWGAAPSYNLCVDTDKFGLEGAANMIAAAVTANY